MNKENIEGWLDALFKMLETFGKGQSDFTKDVTKEGMNIVLDVWDFALKLYVQSMKSKQATKLRDIEQKLAEAFVLAEKAVMAFDAEDMEMFDRIIDARNKLANARIAELVGGEA